MEQQSPERSTGVYSGIGRRTTDDGRPGVDAFCSLRCAATPIKRDKRWVGYVAAADSVNGCKSKLIRIFQLRNTPSTPCPRQSKGCTICTPIYAKELVSKGGKLKSVQNAGVEKIKERSLIIGPKRVDKLRIAIATGLLLLLLSVPASSAP